MGHLTDIGGRTLFFGGMMLYSHFASAMSTPNDALQQRSPLTGDAWATVSQPVLAQVFLRLHVLLPTDIARMMVLDKHRPLVSRTLSSSCFASPGRTLLAAILPASIRIRPRIGGILQNAHDGRECWPLPD